MPSLPNVNDFDWIREQFVNREYFQFAGGMSFRKQLKHTTGNCWTVQCILYAKIPKRNPGDIDFIAWMIHYYRLNPLLLHFQQKLGLLFFTNGYYDFPEKHWKTGDEIISNSRWSTIDEFQTYPIMLDRLAFDKWWFPKFSRVRIWPFYNIKFFNNIYKLQSLTTAQNGPWRVLRIRFGNRVSSK